MNKKWIRTVRYKNPIYWMLQPIAAVIFRKTLDLCRVARRGHPVQPPVPCMGLEPCMDLSIYTAQASAKASFDTRVPQLYFRQTNDFYGN